MKGKVPRHGVLAIVAWIFVSTLLYFVWIDPCQPPLSLKPGETEVFTVENWERWEDGEKLTFPVESGSVFSLVLEGDTVQIYLDKGWTGKEVGWIGEWTLEKHKLSLFPLTTEISYEDPVMYMIFGPVAVFRCANGQVWVNEEFLDFVLILVDPQEFLPRWEDSVT